MREQVQPCWSCNGTQVQVHASMDARCRIRTCPGHRWERLEDWNARPRSPSPAHGGTSALDRLVYGEILCRCNESETPPCVGCQARAEVSEMRARLTALTRERDEAVRLEGISRSLFDGYEGALVAEREANAKLARERDEWRGEAERCAEDRELALRNQVRAEQELADERARAEKARGEAVAVVEQREQDMLAACRDEHAPKKNRDLAHYAYLVLSGVTERLRALAQPRAERETK